MRRNLIPMPRLHEKGFEVRFHYGKVLVGKHSGVLFGEIKVDGSYKLNFSYNNSIVSSSSYFDVSMLFDDPYKWHLILGHINKDKIKRMSKSGLIPDLNVEISTCEPCLSKKRTMLRFSKGQISTELLIIIHSYVRGPLNVKIHGGMKYFIIFIDDYSSCIRHSTLMEWLYI